MVEKSHEKSDDWVGDNEEEDIEEESFKVKREDGESWSIFTNEVERCHVGNKCSKQHIDLEDKDHL